MNVIQYPEKRNKTKTKNKRTKHKLILTLYIIKNDKFLSICLSFVFINIHCFWNVWKTLEKYLYSEDLFTFNWLNLCMFWQMQRTCINVAFVQHSPKDLSGFSVSSYAISKSNFISEKWCCNMEIQRFK